MKTNEEYLAELLPKLREPIPHSWRVQSYSKNKPVATVMAYIDQRDLMEVLDKHCIYGWQKKYEEIAGNLFCSIGINMPDGTTQWRSDCGVESNQDAEKGRASDAAKRAGVNWGVGRFLYDMKIQYVATNVKKEAGNYPYCIDEQGKQIWDLTEYINNKNKSSVSKPVSAPTSIPTPIANTSIPKAPDERVEKAKQALEKVITDTKELVLKQKDFKATTEGANFQSSASIADLVKNNNIDLVLAFYKFVTKK